MQDRLRELQNERQMNDPYPLDGMRHNLTTPSKALQALPKTARIRHHFVYLLCVCVFWGGGGHYGYIYLKLDLEIKRVYIPKNAYFQQSAL